MEDGGRGPSSSDASQAGPGAKKRPREGSDKTSLTLDALHLVAQRMAYAFTEKDAKELVKSMDAYLKDGVASIGVNGNLGYVLRKTLALAGGHDIDTKFDASFDGVGVERPIHGRYDECIVGKLFDGCALALKCALARRTFSPCTKTVASLMMLQVPSCGIFMASCPRLGPSSNLVESISAMFGEGSHANQDADADADSDDTEPLSTPEPIANFINCLTYVRTHRPGLVILQVPFHTIDGDNGVFAGCTSDMFSRWGYYSFNPQVIHNTSFNLGTVEDELETTVFVGARHKSTFPEGHTYSNSKAFENDVMTIFNKWPASHRDLSIIPFSDETIRELMMASPVALLSAMAVIE